MRLDPKIFRDTLTLATQVHMRKQMDDESFEKWMGSPDGVRMIGEFVDEVMAHMTRAGFLDG